tara:strand:- start:608 stop:748 length:141 start_codon:yes stop_codon:yes gene_type:complete
MKRVQNWRDYLQDETPSWKEKIRKKRKKNDDDLEQYTNKKKGNKRK